MSPHLALILCLCCIAWLLINDRRWHQGLSLGSWLPLIWMLIVGSRPVSEWLSPSLRTETAAAYLEGSPVDRTFYQIMISVGIVVLLRRHISWTRLLSSNKWVVLYFAYFGISVLWSEDPFVAFKRWTKDVGNVVMVLIILSERYPAMAAKALLLRCGYVLVPLSVVLTKYFPELTRTYNPWTGVMSQTGVTTNKNLLGMTLVALGIGQVWALMGLSSQLPGKQKRTQLLVYSALLATTGWLLIRAHSATALVCFALGTMTFLLIGQRSLSKHIRIWSVLSVAVIVVLSQSEVWTNVNERVTGLLGRDPTLTGRRAIWDAVLSEETNPLVGVGFYSFWTTERTAQLSAKYHYELNEAHNGYLEMYLNGGMVGLAIFFLMLLSAADRSMSALERDYDDGFDRIRLPVLVGAIFYGLTEAVYSRLDLIWFVLLLVIVTRPRKRLRATTAKRLSDSASGANAVRTRR